MKIHKEKGFCYDSESLAFLQRREETGKVNHPSSSTDCNSPTEITGKLPKALVHWSDLDYKLTYTSQDNDIQLSREYPVFEEEQLTDSNSTSAVTKIASSPNNRTAEARDDSVNKQEKCKNQRNSSTRLDFLGKPGGFKEVFLSVSSLEHLNSSDMSGIEDNDCICGECQVCNPGGSSKEGGHVISAPGSADSKSLLESMKILTSQMNLLQNALVETCRRVTAIEEINAESEKESGKDNKKSNSKGKSKSKKNRVDEERERQYKVIHDTVDTEESEPKKSSTESSEASDVGASSKGLKKKMSRSQKDECNGRVSSCLKKAGTVFPEDDFETSNSSGTDSGKDNCSHKHSHSKVRSGAKVKKKPVKKTELWPHTIANEDGEEVDSENISLAEFLACFTYIQVRSKGAESRGRASLLHAVSKILKFLPWAEARLFHNTIMVKVEQERVSWSDDFLELAEDFLDKKVRSSLRVRHTTATNVPPNNKANFPGRGAGRGPRPPFQNYNSYSNNSNYNNNNNNNFQGRGRPIFGAVCWQWNFNTCTYGADCKRWHVCKTCAESGKLGERHKASTHERPRQH